MNENETYNSAIGQLIEPDPIVYSFNTPGWYMVLGLFLLTLLVIGFRQYRKYKRNAYRREALKKVEAILLQKENNTIYEINTLLKVIALQLFDRQKVASLIGMEWFSFLNSTLKSEYTIAEKEVRQITAALYNPNESSDKNTINELADFAILWINNHRTNV